MKTIYEQMKNPIYDQICDKTDDQIFKEIDMIFDDKFASETYFEGTGHRLCI